MTDPDTTRLLLFDFDGTIADTMEAIVDIYNDVLAPRYRCRPFDRRDIHHVRGLQPRQMIRRYGVKPLLLPMMVLSARRELAQRIAGIKPVPGIHDALLRLAKRPDISLQILTTNSKANVHRFLEQHGLGHAFERILTTPTMFGKGRRIRHAVRRAKAGRDHTVYIGDEVRDIEAGRGAGVRTVGVTWGFNLAAAIEAAAPDRVVHDAGSLVRACEELLSL